MPELPEVETIKLGLQKYLIGHKIIGIEILNPKSFDGSAEQIIGSKITSIERFGKGLIINFDNKKSLAIHIKMTGQLIYRDKFINKIDEEKVGELPGKHTRVIFKLDKDAVLFFNDIRKFGWMKVVPSSKVGDLPFFKNLGPEPFKDLTTNKFINLVSDSKLAIKVLIMDQKKIAGVGNIYACDALFLAKINPKRIANTLSKKEAINLYDAILEVMRKSIKFGGSSENTYVNALGNSGSYQRHTLVYGKKGESCKVCKTEIKRIALGGRGTFFCPKCQK